MIKKIINKITVDVKKNRILKKYNLNQFRDLSNEDHIESALQWFKQTIHSNGGSSAGYDMILKEFLPPYPETTGYWIKTLYRVKKLYSSLFNRVFESIDVIDGCVEWLLTIQRDDGTFPGSYGNYSHQEPIVFNNGQIILGLLEHYNHTEEEKILKSIIKVADWLVEVQSESGVWDKYTHCQYSSNTRTGYALIQLGKLTNIDKYYIAGVKNIDYAISCQQGNGYFNNNGFYENETAYTHTIAYAIRGIWEAGLLESNEQWLLSSMKGYKYIVELMDESGFLGGAISQDFTHCDSYCCLTGNAQLSIIGFKAYEKYQEPFYLERGTKLLNYVKNTQFVSTEKNVSGGIAGSWPISGDYSKFKIPNWSAKFFIDALIYENKLGVDKKVNS